MGKKKFTIEEKIKACLLYTSANVNPDQLEKYFDMERLYDCLLYTSKKAFHHRKGQMQSFQRL